MSKYQEIDVPGVLRGSLQPGTRAFKKRPCQIFLSPPYEKSGWHMTISSTMRHPTWEEIRDAWYDLVPDAENKTAALILPPKIDYINVHEHCFQVHELKEKF